MQMPLSIGNLDSHAIATTCNRRRCIGSGGGLRSSTHRLVQTPPIAEDHADADYMLFLNHLRVDGNSYIYERNLGGSAPALRVKYEEDEGASVEEVQLQPKTLGVSGGKRTWTDEAMKRPSAKRSEVSDSRSPTGLIAGGSLVDEDYQKHLNHLKQFGGSMTNDLGENAAIVCKEEYKDDETEQENEEDDFMVIEHDEFVEEIDAWPIAMEKEPHDIYLQPFSPSGMRELQDHSYLVEILRHKPSLFRSRLIYILRKPFDENEYQRMMSLFNLRKPIVKLKHLRVQSIAYRTDQLGYSYRDHFPDLAQRIDSAVDHSDKDLYLRGFFFWLQNVGYEEAFRPWLPALPKSSYVAIDIGDGKTTLAIDVSDGEEVEGKEREEIQEKKERKSNSILNQEEEKLGLKVQKEDMAAEIALCKKENDACYSEMEIKPECDSFQLPISSGLRASGDVIYYVKSLIHGVTSSFRSRLTSVLEKPFDQVEYENLMSLIRKPAKNFKHVNDESGAHTPDQQHYLYLDHYPDLACQVNSANPSKVLFLLRGFFFWLQNLCHEDAYKPWALDELQLKAKKLFAQIDIPED